MKREIYSSQRGNDGTSGMLRIIKEIAFSDDPRDFGYMADNVPCQHACPAATNVPGYIRCITENRYGRSYELNRVYNILPATLGRICSRPCEAACRHGEDDLGDPVNICHLKRSAADLKPAMHRIKEDLYAPSGKSVAVIGSGPAGIGAAHDLAVYGHNVTLYESMPEAGGMLRYGIPAFRLPRDILDLEIENVLRLGVVLRTRVLVGHDIVLKDLLKKHDAVITTVGCMEPNRLGVEGEEMEGVISGLDYMVRTNLGQEVETGRRVIVVGDGFTAMDCARTSLRMGAESVRINILATEEHMPVDDHEIREVKVEGGRIYSLVSTHRILGTGGRVEGIEFLRTRLEDTPDGKGRIAVPIENSEFVMEADTIISAIGQHPLVDLGQPLNMDGQRIGVKPGRYLTSVDRLYAAGDCVTGASNVISALAAGRHAAHEVDELFAGRRRKALLVRFEPAEQTDREREYDFIKPVAMPTLPVEERFEDADNEVEEGYGEAEAVKESLRCYLCSLKYEIDVSRCIYCSMCIDVAPRDCIKMISSVAENPDGSYGEYGETGNWNDVVAIAIDNKRCIRCGKCYEVCPMDCITITKTELVEVDREE
ncbi:FAD-dependent oxidoreductase [Desulfoluna spongiiphila]|uniref:NADPH-dependent glutamate synthase beta chain n=1 Tax=Desulfoluna spongiiphila TaxID=419481 RepID=A0A1G5GC13_9BACT|nr:FAD-dependent oxidoreductase [Desulfoluna spongiiphila]SCY49083.1 NADPH-dependent glutamate synthase beta chain [Desulfoluna spongiiphila]VVS93648.1 alpha-helical ferredoxin [Desulfoluna spongiiphila]